MLSSIPTTYKSLGRFQWDLQEQLQKTFAISRSGIKMALTKPVFLAFSEIKILAQAKFLVLCSKAAVRLQI